MGVELGLSLRVASRTAGEKRGEGYPKGQRMFGLFVGSACGAPLTMVPSLSSFVFLEVNENKSKQDQIEEKQGRERRGGRERNSEGKKGKQCTGIARETVRRTCGEGVNYQLKINVDPHKIKHVGSMGAASH